MPALAFGAIIGVVQQLLGSHYVLFMLYLVMNLLDLLSGILSANYRHTFSSREMLKGVARKLGYWIMIAVAFGVAFALQGIGNTLSIDLSVTNLLGWATISILFVHEARSVLGHLVEMGIHVPRFLIDILNLAEDKITNGQGEFDGTMVVDTSDPEKDTYRLELNASAHELASKSEIRFKVVCENQ